MCLNLNKEHEHNFKNCVLHTQEKVIVDGYIVVRDAYRLASACAICGQILEFSPQKDSYDYWEQYHNINPRPKNGNISRDAMIEAYRKRLPTYEVTSLSDDRVLI